MLFRSLIGRDGEWLAFIEVKTRSSSEFGSPDSAIDSRKRLNILRAAADYLRRAGLEWDCARFDTVNVVLRDPAEVEVLKDAFTRRSVESSVRRVGPSGQQRGERL